MFAIQRQQKIIELLTANKSVDVGVLSKLFNVSEVTIRRDLGKLEEDGVAIKTYGGALLREEISEEEPGPPVNDSGMVRLCTALVESGDAVFLGSDPAAVAIARAVKGMALNVITNDLSVACEFRDSTTVRVFVIGNQLVRGTTTLVGECDRRLLETLNISKCFLRVDGGDLTAGFTLSTPEECRLVSEVLPLSSKVIVLARRQAFLKSSLFRLFPLDTPQAVVTDTDLPTAFKEYFFSKGIGLYTPFDLD